MLYIPIIVSLFGLVFAYFLRKQDLKEFASGFLAPGLGLFLASGLYFISQSTTLLIILGFAACLAGLFLPYFFKKYEQFSRTLQTYIIALVSALILARAVFPQTTEPVFLLLFFAGLAVLAQIIAIFLVKAFPAKFSNKQGLVISTALSLVGFLLLTWQFGRGLDFFGVWGLSLVAVAFATLRGAVISFGQVSDKLGRAHEITLAALILLVLFFAYAKELLNLGIAASIPLEKPAVLASLILGAGLVYYLSQPRHVAEISLAVLLPALFGIILGAEALAGFLAGSVAAGIILVLFGFNATSKFAQTIGIVALLMTLFFG